MSVAIDVDILPLVAATTLAGAPKWDGPGKAAKQGNTKNEKQWKRTRGNT